MTAMKEIHWFDTATGVKENKKQARVQKRWAARRAALALSGAPPTSVDLELRDRAQMETDEDYRRFLTSRCGPDAVFGDMTPGYSRLQAEGYRRLLDVFPQARFILLLRNPADNMWSRLAHRRDNANAPGRIEDNLRVFLDGGGSRMTSQRIETIYARAREHVVETRIHCLFTEDLFSHHADAALGDLCAFLRITGKLAAQNTYDSNRGTYAPMPPELRKRTASHFAQSYHFAERLMGRVPDNWAREMEQL